MRRPAAGVARLAHYALRPTDLAASLRFYTEALGLAIGPRPPFGFPGAWLYAPDDLSGQGLVHLIGQDEAGGLERYLGSRAGGAGGGAVDHFAFSAAGWSRQRARLVQLGIGWRERIAPGIGLRQVFLQDPDGVAVELNYPAEEPV